MIHSATLVDAYLLSSCDLWHVNVAEVNKWHHRKTTIHVHAENSNGTTVGRVFKFKSFPWSFLTGVLRHGSSKMENKFGLDCAAVVQNSVILLQTIDDCCDQAC